MQTLKLSIAQSGSTCRDVEFRLSCEDLACDLIITVPAGATVERLSGVDERIVRLPAANLGRTGEEDGDDYVLGGYAGI
ncbi:hypothetical protein [Dokdonella sp.]|uniref:hypothetical protein n=1 Tax=Dokdonella sp. TaxID=2291710 RepID=UPI0026100A0B|nr:hypothetical protein [Dokdonella sp.]